MIKNLPDTSDRLAFRLFLYSVYGVARHHGLSNDEFPQLREPFRIYTLVQIRDLDHLCISVFQQLLSIEDPASYTITCPLASLYNQGIRNKKPQHHLQHLKQMFSSSKSGQFCTSMSYITIRVEGGSGICFSFICISLKPSLFWYTLYEN